MDIDSNMNLDDFEKVVERVAEGSEVVVPVESINEDMVLAAINNNFDDNRIMTIGLNMSVLDLLKDELELYNQKSVRGKYIIFSRLIFLFGLCI